MDRDFHYYGTLLAAATAGFDYDQARTVATSAQFIDDCTEIVSHSSGLTQWSANVYTVNMGDNKVANFCPIVTSVYGMLTWAPTSNYDETRQIWMPFHFLPGNFEISISTLREKVGKPNNENDLHLDSKDSIQLLCRPRSDSAQNMINFARHAYAEIKKQDEEMALMLVGCVMHVFADTYAHQDFAGTSSTFLNGTKNGASSEPGSFTIYGRWEGIKWVPDESSYREIVWPAGGYFNKHEIFGDFLNSYPPYLYGLSNTPATGHGQLGHLPDVSTIAFKYTPNWSDKERVRNNPQQFMDAFVDMTLALKSILNNTEFNWNAEDVRKRHIDDLTRGSALAVVQQLICPDNKSDIDTRAYDQGLRIPTDQWFLKSEERWSDALNQLLVINKNMAYNGKPYNPIPGFNDAKYGWVKEVAAFIKKPIPLAEFKSLRFFKWNVAAKLLFRQNYGQLRCMGNGVGRIVRDINLSRTMNPCWSLQDEFSKFWHPDSMALQNQNNAILGATDSDQMDNAFLSTYQSLSQEGTTTPGWVILKSEGNDGKYVSYAEKTPQIDENGLREENLTSYIPEVTQDIGRARPLMLIQSASNKDSFFIRTFENMTGQYLFLEYPTSLISKTLWYNSYADNSNQQWKRTFKTGDDKVFSLESAIYKGWFLGIDGAKVKAVNNPVYWEAIPYSIPPIFTVGPDKSPHPYPSSSLGLG